MISRREVLAIGVAASVGVTSCGGSSHRVSVPARSTQRANSHAVGRRRPGPHAERPRAARPLTPAERRVEAATYALLSAYSGLTLALSEGASAVQQCEGSYGATTGTAREYLSCLATARPGLQRGVASALRRIAVAADKDHGCAPAANAIVAMVRHSAASFLDLERRLEDGVRTTHNFLAYDYGEGLALEEKIYAAGGLDTTSGLGVPRRVEAAVMRWSLCLLGQGERPAPVPTIAA